MSNYITYRNTLIKLSSLLICLIPLALLTGPFLPDLFLTCIVIIFIFFTLKENLWEKYYRNIYSIIAFIFFFYLLLSSVFSENITSSLETSIFYFRFIIFSLSVWFLINHDKSLIKKFSICLLITFILALTDGIFQIFNESNIFGFVNITENRMTLLLNDKQILGGYLSRLFPLLFGVLIYSFNINMRSSFLLMILLIITDVVVYISGERTAIGLLFLETILIIIFISKFKLLRLTSLIASISLIILITFLNEDIKKRNIDYSIEQLNIITPSDVDETENTDTRMKLFSSQHESHFITAFNMFKANPIFGVGPGQFENYCDDDRYFYNEFGCSTHPHNTYVQVLSEIGLIGFCFLLLASIYVLSRFLKLIQNMIYKKSLVDDFEVCMLISFALTLWPILPTQDFFNNWINIIYFMPVGFFLHRIYDKNK